MKNISNIKNCYGCGVCAVACPKKIISIFLNQDGFYEPRIDELDKCIECSVCVNVCAYSHETLAHEPENIHSFAGWSNNDETRLKSTSGGVGFEIGKALIQNGYKVCGVRYNVENGRAEHYISHTIEDLKQSAGSKYIQSYTVDGFSAIKRKEKYLVTGTPCQIDSFRRYIQKFRIEDNFVLLDCFCHGIPSMWVWKKYLQDIKVDFGTLQSVSWRNKSIPSINNSVSKIAWHNSYNLFFKGTKTDFFSQHSDGDLFFAFFLGNACLGKACYDKCKYKGSRSSADIRIGDLWGKTYQGNKDGVNAVIAFTEKGNQVLRNVACTLIEHPLDLVIEGQLKQNIKRHPKYEKVRQSLNCPSSSLNEVYRIIYKYDFKKRFLRLLQNPCYLLRKIKERISK